MTSCELALIIFFASEMMYLEMLGNLIKYPLPHSILYNHRKQSTYSTQRARVKKVLGIKLLCSFRVLSFSDRKSTILSLIVSQEEIRLKNFNGAADLFFCAGGTAPGTSQMDSWSGAGQRDYHYSLYNKRKFEEVCIC